MRESTRQGVFGWVVAMVVLVVVNLATAGRLTWSLAILPALVAWPVGLGMETLLRAKGRQPATAQRIGAVLGWAIVSAYIALRFGVSGGSLAVIAVTLLWPVGSFLVSPDYPQPPKDRTS